jgi:hypothetical protein
MFNLARCEILEYSREIVEVKLRELKPAESGFIAELDTGFKQARRNFKGRGVGIRRILDSAPQSISEKEEWVDSNALSENITDEIDILVETEEL